MLINILTLFFCVLVGVGLFAALIFILRSFSRVSAQIEAAKKAASQIDQAEPDVSYDVIWWIAAVFQILQRKKARSVQKQLTEPTNLLPPASEQALQEITKPELAEPLEETTTLQQNQHPLLLAQLISDCIEKVEQYRAHKIALSKSKSLAKQTEALKSEEEYQKSFVVVQALKKAQEQVINTQTQALIMDEEIKALSLQTQIEKLENPDLARAKEEAINNFYKDLVKNLHIIMANNYMKFGSKLDSKQLLQQDKERRMAEVTAAISNEQKKQQVLNDIEAAYAECLKQEANQENSPKASAKKFGVRL